MLAADDSQRPQTGSGTAGEYNSFFANTHRTITLSDYVEKLGFNLTILIDNSSILFFLRAFVRHVFLRDF